MKNKKIRYRVLGVIIIPLVIITIALGFVAFSSVNKMTNMNKDSEMKMSIESMDYHLRSNPTALQEELFKELIEACDSEERDDLHIAELVVENFVADFYTWTNKYGQFDVGGLYYVYSPLKNNIYDYARDTFYRYINHYINEYGQDEVLEVKEVNASGEFMDEGYDIEGEHLDEVYWIEADLTYADKAMPTDGLDTHLYFTVIKNEDGRFEIVQSYGEE